MRLKSVSGVAVGVALLAMVASPSSANTRVVVEKNNKFERLWEGNTACEGFTFTERFSVRRTITEVYDDAGDLVRETFHVKFTGEATNDSTGGSLDVDGTRRMVFDYEAGTFTESGVLRHVTARGEGIVLQQVGRVIENIDDEDIVYFQTPQRQIRDEDMDRFCAALANA